MFNILLCTGSFACGMAFHNCASRYLYALGREGLSKGLQKTIGATHPKHGSPHIASFVQSGITLVLILAFLAAGMDPYVHMYTLLAILGTMAILIVQSLCAFAVIAYFHFRKNHPTSKHWFRTLPRAAARRNRHAVRRAICCGSTRRPRRAPRRAHCCSS